MVDVIDNSAAPPPELVLAWDCERYHSLPEAGGVLDQDYALMQKMNALNNIYQAFSAYRSAKGQDIHRLPGWVRQNVAYLLDVGIGVGLDG